MKTINLDAPAASARDINVGNKIKSLIFKGLLKLNPVLPSDCQITTSQDALYVAAVACLTVSLIFPLCIIPGVYCVIKAQKGGSYE